MLITEIRGMNKYKLWCKHDKQPICHVYIIRIQRHAFRKCLCTVKKIPYDNKRVVQDGTDYSSQLVELANKLAKEAGEQDFEDEKYWREAKICQLILTFTFRAKRSRLGNQGVSYFPWGWIEKNWRKDKSGVNYKLYCTQWDDGKFKCFPIVSCMHGYCKDISCEYGNKRADNHTPIFGPSLFCTCSKSFILTANSWTAGESSV